MACGSSFSALRRSGRFIVTYRTRSRVSSTTVSASAVRSSVFPLTSDAACEERAPLFAGSERVEGETMGRANKGYLWLNDAEDGSRCGFRAQS